MKKDITMRKSSFINGAIITTFGIVLSKILGLFYVIPFYSIIGERGGALYGYAYTIYTFFMSLASAGVPLAISKLVCEYQALGYYQTKQRVFYLGKKVALILGVICFLFLFFLAPLIAKAILGNVVGGNSISDVSFVIRVIAISILIVPLLSIYRGYFEGHRLFSPPSISQVLEQLVRVLVIIIGSFSAIKLFHLSVTFGVSIALFGASLGSFVSYLYLFEKRIKNKKKFQERLRKVNEPQIQDKVILMKLFYYAIPFILIDIFKSFYGTIDMLSVVKGLVKYANYNAKNAEIVYSIFSTWGQKFNMIVLSVSTGVVVSLIPNLTDSILKEKNSDIQKNINSALSVLLFLTIPMSFGISFLSNYIWILFYGKSTYGGNVLSYYIFSGLFLGIFTTFVSIFQTLKDYKVVLISLVSGVFVKLLLNIYLLKSFYSLSFPAYYGPITASILGYCLSLFICLFYLKKKYLIHFEKTLVFLIDIICGSVLMILVLFIFKVLIPFHSFSRFLNLLVIIFYVIVGVIVYFLYMHFTGIFKKNFGMDMKSFINKYIQKK